jgi:hypothetical protein
MPHQATPRPALPGQASPYLPRPALPDLAPPSLAGPSLACPARPCQTLPHLDRPRRATPDPPRRATPYQALPRPACHAPPAPRARAPPGRGPRARRAGGADRRGGRRESRGILLSRARNRQQAKEIGGRTPSPGVSSWAGYDPGKRQRGGPIQDSQGRDPPMTSISPHRRRREGSHPGPIRSQCSRIRARMGDEASEPRRARSDNPSLRRLS